MKRFILSIALIVSALNGLLAQLNLPFTQPDALFVQAQDLYAQQKYAASLRSFEDFLRLSPSIDAAQLLETDFYLAANAYYLQNEDALARLDAHLNKYPNTPFTDRTDFMRAMLNYAQRRYAQALRLFNGVDEHKLNDREQADFKLYKGYTFVEAKKYSDARTLFAQLKKLNTRYNNAATYYYGYTEYMLGNYDAALPEFLAIELVPQYANIVPYYLMQIYYRKKNTAKVREYADFLLKNNANNQNNAEVYRILGEIAFDEKKYGDAVKNLSNYQKMFPQVLRNDLYMLGLSYYRTNDCRNAVGSLSKVTTDNDSITENAYLYLGNAYVKLGEKSNARMAYESALATNFTPAVREQAMYNYALTTYETTPGLGIEDPNANCKDCKQKTQAQTGALFGQSIKAFEQFISTYPQSSKIDEAYNYLASIYSSTEDFGGALISFNKIKNPSAKMLETKQYLLYRQGIINCNQKKLSAAIQNFSDALDASQTGKYLTEVYFWRGNAYFLDKQFSSAEEDFKQFFARPDAKTSSNFTLANYFLGYVFFNKNDYRSASAWFLKYLNLEKEKKSATYADALNRAGDCEFSARDFSKADSHYRQAAAANESVADYAMFQSGYVAGLQKNYDEKIRRMNDLVKKYPKSEYAPQALFEVGRAYVMKKDANAAIETYNNLIKKYPSAPMSRKAALEIGMVYYNEGKTEEAISAYKSVISRHNGSEEAYAALEALESIYIDSNRTQEYLAYSATVGSMGKSTAQYGDSISYLAAERQYIAGNYAQVIPTLKAYLEKYCPGGRDCITARFYLADSYYRTDDHQNALAQFQALLAQGESRYSEISTMRCAEITYDMGNYKSSLSYFKNLLTFAQTAENRNAARLGILRCSVLAGEYETVVSVANEIFTDPRSPENLKNEARFNRAKAYIVLGQTDKAADDLKPIVANTQTEWGAEANFLLAKYWFDKKDYAKSEKTIMDFTEKGTVYPYWLARCMVLLADISIEQQDDFQAKQYLLSLQRNYTVQDDVQPLITERLAAIETREKEKLVK